MEAPAEVWTCSRLIDDDRIILADIFSDLNS